MLILIYNDFTNTGCFWVPHNVHGFMAVGYLKYVRPATELVFKINLFPYSNHERKRSHHDTTWWCKMLIVIPSSPAAIKPPVMWRSASAESKPFFISLMIILCRPNKIHGQSRCNSPFFLKQAALIYFESLNKDLKFFSPRWSLPQRSF